MKTVIEMAREAGFNLEQGFLLRITGIDEDLERFAELVRADERKHIITKNTPEIERCNSHIKALEQEILRARGQA
jgi:Pyruvate/2-oxoacid:ferredoxin oxidoreductase gamma subunit